MTSHRPGISIMPKSYGEECRNLADLVLSNERGLNTPEHRLELSTSIERLIETYVAFERQKLRYGSKNE